MDFEPIRLNLNDLEEFGLDAKVCTVTMRRKVAYETVNNVLYLALEVSNYNINRFNTWIQPLNSMLPHLLLIQATSTLPLEPHWVPYSISLKLPVQQQQIIQNATVIHVTRLIVKLKCQTRTFTCRTSRYVGFTMLPGGQLVYTTAPFFLDVGLHRVCFVCSGMADADWNVPQAETDFEWRCTVLNSTLETALSPYKPPGFNHQDAVASWASHLAAQVSYALQSIASMP
jgi:hypothetical protein